MAQIRSIVSESLEAQVRSLLPSQNGFTEDLQAQNVIVPVIDLTSAAGAAGLAESLQQALAFGSQTAYSQVGAGTTVIANTPGFWRIFGNVTSSQANAAYSVSFDMTDGLTTKTVWEIGQLSSVGSNQVITTNVDFIVFLASGESISTVCSTNLYTASVGSVRQIATANGTLVNPSGFTSQ